MAKNLRQCLRAIILILIFTALPFGAFSAAQVAEYVDNEYQFAFQFPLEWKKQIKPIVGAVGEVRIMVSHPTEPMYVMASVGQLRTQVTKDKYDANPNREAIVAALVQFTLDQVYKKTSEEKIKADRMLVLETKTIPSNVGIKFYISTLNLKGNVQMVVAGTHMVPFGKPYIVTFMMIAPFDKSATKDKEVMKNVFNSFHIIGETPLQ